MFSQKLLTKAKKKAVEIIEKDEVAGEIAIGKKGRLVITRKVSDVDPLTSFVIQEQQFFIGLPAKR